MGKATGVWLNHPWLDYVGPAASLAIWFFAGHAPTLDSNVALYVLTALAASSGIVLAVVALMVGLVYQSSNDLIMQARTAFAKALRSTFSWMFCALLACTLLPILGMIFVDSAGMLSAGIAWGAGSLVGMVLIRVIVVLRMVLKTHEIGEQQQREAGPKVTWKKSQSSLH
jgi:hypothetical protein